uniref:Protein kinase domain-containing protein n=1 Tax=Aplanochytrium stocchinoi TaxID=215587 RepID=A0A7S3PF44_9STRA|mmetsp:Transcript_7323/g.8849  ORF Transcript_7323/g.8849 Transcript_7323/m.8849 type:complete len:411 (+) Transcript_7323:94-1326(+)|eukprot:CAMPEP_0204831246 /NCGR_PEP_ID=MMETSP1346-20131115/10219_1 /ASSEMBLY_ACC=CAM_ASM_000771 /TAXON_ID=215587 /ORGANISM="Aplanochytrium stocchinoi, Strain GSBS06" /LENGTH=410 /DNA_ID=CAMNT_0051962127 /DNA_START=42 /DNA_END=1274 /DNA_ORIENTATION=-
MTRKSRKKSDRRGKNKKQRASEKPKMVIGAPSPHDFKRVAHVEVDPASSLGFKGLPTEWKELLKASGISKERVLQENQQVLKALEFATGKFGNNKVPLLTAEQLQRTMARKAPVQQKNPSLLYKKIEKLGEGAGGIVFKIEDKKSKEISAVKISPKAELQYIETEIAIHAMSKHKNIVNYKATYLWKQEVWIVMDLVDGGCLTDFLGENCPDPWSESCIAYVMANSLEALAYMHNKHLLHRDIKSDNILVGKDGTVKLADFGFAVGLTSEKNKTKSTVGTPFWMAPEVIEGREYDSRCDIWSLGITAIELVNDEPPHMDKTTLEALLDIITLPAPKPKRDEICSNEFLDFLDKALKKDYTKRLLAHELLQHAFLQKSSTEKDFSEWIKYVIEEGGEERIVTNKNMSDVSV